jgi:hypothetical protein
LGKPGRRRGKRASNKRKVMLFRDIGVREKRWCGVDGGLSLPLLEGVEECVMNKG